MNSVIIITKDTEKTEFMQACDVFSDNKVLLGGIFHLEVNDIDIAISKIPEHYDVIAVFSTCGKGWRDESIKTISFDKKWALFADFLKAQGMKIT